MSVKYDRMLKEKGDVLERNEKKCKARLANEMENMTFASESSVKGSTL